jgi:putative ATP-grasp target RiPP
MLTDPRHLFPLDTTVPDPDPATRPENGVLPFGLKRAVRADTIDVDLPSISYDPARQIAVITDGDDVLPAMHHTSTNTKTSTASQDRKGNDSDSDSTGT